MKRDGATKSLWQNDIPDYHSNPFTYQDELFDVVIVGGGITGITTALLLQKAGKKCLLAEAQNLAFGTTSGTTAHLNTILDLTYSEIEKKFGEENAKLVLKATWEAIKLVEDLVAEHNIDCGFSKKDGYLFSVDKQQTRQLKDAFEASKKAGCEVEYADSIPVPVDFQKALLFKNQAQIHPAKYVYALAKAFEDRGGTIAQQCRVTGVTENEEKILEVETSIVNKIRARSLIYATHIPPGVNLLHFRCAPYRSYAMAVTLKDDNYPDALAYDLFDPYHYYRAHEINGKKYLIAGGEDHKTAEKKDTEECFLSLEKYLRTHFQIEEIAFKWSSQYFQSADGLPYIGHLPGNPDTVFVATGYGGNGITYSQAAAKILTDLVTNNHNEFKNLFNPSRIKPVAGFANFAKNAADVTGHFIGKLFPADKINGINELANGEAKVVKYEGDSIAMYKDENGSVHAVNPSCTHINCLVAWNTAEKVWECPCHGSRFSEEGEMYTAPARKDLEKITLSGAEPPQTNFF
jgi:glycine/D-amino acid oxidase-like deaminating enzyme/nitrite reductase/ring-hydroxylating ferredoxin subunit